jgi:hypothetical protein
MFVDEDQPGGSRVSTAAAFRHLVIFQLKLAADALRDFLLSPLSILAFGLDVLRKPHVENSLYLRLMLLGRRSDRMINLFDDHSDSGEFTIDRAVDELEELLRAGRDAAGATGAEATGEAPSDKGPREKE